MKIGACQLPEVRESPDRAIAWICQCAERASEEGAGLLCFPECFLQGYLCEPATARRHAISLRGAEFKHVLRRVSDAKPMLVFGLIESHRDVLYNTAVVVDAGRLVGTHRKINLLPGERSTFTPGVRADVFEVDGVTFGINICSDTQDPALATAVASAGAKLIVCPANNMMPRQRAEQWKDQHNRTRACRAREASAWLMSSDVTGTRGNRAGLGPTCVLDPRGNVVVQVPTRAVGMVLADIGFDGSGGGHNHTLQWTGTAWNVLVS